MKKIRKTLAFVVLLFMVTTTNGQIFETEDVASSRLRAEEDPNGIIPLNGVLLDQTNAEYTPVGDGLLLLAALGGAYLLRKKMNNLGR